MGYQSSRIIWGKKYLDDNDNSDAYLTPITNWEHNVIYNSGCQVVYYDMFISSSNFTLAVYQCQVEETAVEPSIYTETVWKKLKGIQYIETVKSSYIPIPDSKAEQVINAPRVVYKPGSKVIIKDGVVDEKIVYHVYECDRETNVKYEGFDRSKWHIVKQHTGRLFQPVDHKEVYYDDGKNKSKFHYAMYYVPEEPDTMEDEITEFNEFIEYAKGEYALDYGSELAKQKGEPDTLFKYIHNIPSMPSRENPYKEGYDYIQPRPSESTSRDQLFNGTWEKVETVEYFDKLKAYSKGDLIVFNQYYVGEEGEDDHNGRGWFKAPVIPFQKNYVYKYGQYCLYRIKTSEEANISDSDCDKLIETGDYELVELNPDAPEEYKIYDKKAVSLYGQSIESNQEIYGLYKYIGSTDKRQGYLFTNSDWELVATAKMWAVDNAKYMEGYTAGEYVIAPYANSYALFRATGDISPDYYFTESDYNKWEGAGKPISTIENFMSFGYFVPYMQVEDRRYKGVRATPLDIDDTPLAKTIWDLPIQKYYDTATGYRVFEAVKDIPANTDFSNENWLLKTQEKMTSLNLYGWIWRKYEFGSGGTPYGSDLIFQTLDPDYTNRHSKVRFNNLSIYRGGNRLTVGALSTNTSTHNFYNFSFCMVGNMVYYFNTDTFYIKAPLNHGWYKFSLYDILTNSGLEYTYPVISANNFWPNQVLSIIFRTMPNTISLWKIQIVDLENKTFFVTKTSMTFDDESSVRSQLSWIEGYTTHGFSDVDYDKALLYLPLGVSHYGDVNALSSFKNFLTYHVARNSEGNVIAKYPDYDYYEELVIPQLTADTIYRLSFNQSMMSEDSLIEYLWDSLRVSGIHETNPTHTISFRYYVFEDGWYGDKNSPGTEYYERELSLHYSYALNDVGVYGFTQRTETIYEREYVSTYDRWSNAKTFIIFEWEQIGKIYYALSVSHNDLLKDTYGVVRPPDDPDHPWIDRDPIYAQRYFYSQDKTVLYVLRGFCGYFASDLVVDHMREHICYYELFFMDIYFNGVRKTLRLVESKTMNYEQYNLDHEAITLAVMSTTFMLSQRYLGGDYEFNIIYIFDDVKTYLNENNECVLSGGFICLLNARHDQTGTPVRSSGLHLIPMHDARYEYCQYPPEYEVTPVDSLEVFFYPALSDNIATSRRALWNACHIEYIPYQGGDTCHLNGLNRDIKYITIDIGQYMKYGDYYESKLQEYEDNDCLYYSFNLYGAPENKAPVVNQSTGSYNASSQDIIIDTIITIEGNGRTAFYNICIVLPFFKTVYANNATRNLSSGKPPYDPKETGAFFWLTTDDILYKAEPQYGGAEDGAQGFSGW